MTPALVVALPPGWAPLGPVPGALLAAAAAARDGSVVATMVIRVERCPGLRDADDVAAVLAAVPAGDPEHSGVRELRFCGPEAVAVLAASATPGLPISAEDLAAALAQTAVYAVDSTGVVISPSSAGDTNAPLSGNTRTV